MTYALLAALDANNPWVVAVGACAGLTAIWLAVRRPVKWVGRRLFGEPAAAWLDSIITAVVRREVKEPDGNGGHNLTELSSQAKANHLAIISLETTMHAFGERLQEVGRKAEVGSRAAESARLAASEANMAAVKAQAHTEELIAELTAVNGGGRSGKIDRRT